MKLNTKAINDLADFIEKAKYEFDMGDAFARPECGSAGCIGGHAAMKWPSVRGALSSNSASFRFDDDALAKRLGVSDETLHDLCYGVPTPSGNLVYLRDITRRAAVDALRHLAKTGTVRFLHGLCRKAD